MCSVIEVVSIDDVDGLLCPSCGFVNLVPVERFPAVRRCKQCHAYFVERRFDAEGLPVAVIV